jgi:hypothetical protein
MYVRPLESRSSGIFSVYADQAGVFRGTALVFS